LFISLAFSLLYVGSNEGEIKMENFTKNLKVEDKMKTNHKGNKTSKFVKTVLFVAFLGLASGCGGGASSSNPGLVGGNQGLTGNSTGITGSTVAVAGQPQPPTAIQMSAKMDLCAQVNGWATDCRFVGMKYLKMNETITPLTEKFRSKNRRRGGDA